MPTETGIIHTGQPPVNWSLARCFDDTVGDGLNQCVIATGNHQDSDSLRGAPPRRPDPKSDLDGRILGNTVWLRGGNRRLPSGSSRTPTPTMGYSTLPYKLQFDYQCRVRAVSTRRTAIHAQTHESPVGASPQTPISPSGFWLFPVAFPGGKRYDTGEESWDGTHPQHTAPYGAERNEHHAKNRSC